MLFSFVVVVVVCVLKQELFSNYLLTNFISTIASEYGILCIVIAKNSSKCYENNRLYVLCHVCRLVLLIFIHLLCSMLGFQYATVVVVIDHSYDPFFLEISKSFSILFIGFFPVYIPTSDNECVTFLVVAYGNSTSCIKEYGCYLCTSCTCTKCKVYGVRLYPTPYFTNMNNTP